MTRKIFNNNFLDIARRAVEDEALDRMEGGGLSSFTLSPVPGTASLLPTLELLAQADFLLSYFATHYQTPPSTGWVTPVSESITPTNVGLGLSGIDFVTVKPLQLPYNPTSPRRYATPI